MRWDYIEIDGTMGEGGGQVLRASLALSMALGKPFHISGIRGKRPKPGLKRQHLTCVKAAQAVCKAKVAGAAMNSTELYFVPGPVVPGEYSFSIGSGGSIILVLQALLPPLLVAGAPSRITVSGGTHVPHAPPFEFIEETLLPRLIAMGPRVTAAMTKPGYMDVGGGSVTVDIVPAEKGLKQMEESRPASFSKAEAVIYCHHLPKDIAEREVKVLLSDKYAPLGLERRSLCIEDGSARTAMSEGAGNAVLVKIHCGNHTMVFSEYGWKGRTAERVAHEVCKRALAFAQSGLSIDRHLADQLVVPMALAGGGSFVTEKLTKHTETCLELLPIFTALRATVNVASSAHVRISIA